MSLSKLRPQLRRLCENWQTTGIRRRALRRLTREGAIDTTYHVEDYIRVSGQVDVELLDKREKIRSPDYRVKRIYV